MATPTPRAPPEGLRIHGSRTSPKGRSLVATKPFPAGSLIATFPSTSSSSSASSSIALPAAASLTTTCNYCLVPASSSLTPKRCTACLSAAYCSPRCQKADWSLVHAKECKVLRRASSGSAGANANSTSTQRLPAFCRVAIRILLRPDLYGVLEEELEGHVEEFAARKGPGRAWERVEVPGRVIPGWVYVKDKERGGERREEDVRRVISLLCKIQTNAFSRSDDESGKDGLFIDPTLAMANHSCMPNAIVTFSGRKAFLTALRDIKTDDEIEVSYIDFTQPLAKRRENLEPYFFECACDRCKDDLDNYQVAMRTPASIIKLNRISLMSDLAKFGAPPRAHQTGDQPPSQASTDDAILPPDADVPLPERRRQLRRTYTTWAPVRSREWALKPAGTFLAQALSYYTQLGNFEAALAVACLAAVASEPFQHVEPFHIQRLKGCMSIVNILTNTAPNEEQLGRFTQRVSGAASQPLPQAQLDLLAKLDQLSLCQMLLLNILKWVPIAYTEECDLYAPARGMLQELGSLGGRDRENGIIEAWDKDPTDPKMADFFAFAVTEPVAALAELGASLLEIDFGSDIDICTS